MQASCFVQMIDLAAVTSTYVDGWFAASCRYTAEYFFVLKKHFVYFKNLKNFTFYVFDGLQ